jgi:dihydropteroate synthase
LPRRPPTSPSAIGAGRPRTCTHGRSTAAAGIPPARVIVDPGFGFGKQGAQNWELLHGLPRIVGMGPRVLVGTSRKRFLAEALEDGEAGEATEVRRDLATAVTSVLADEAGVWAVRVHDVASTRDALRIAGLGKGTDPWSPTRSR